MPLHHKFFVRPGFKFLVIGVLLIGIALAIPFSVRAAPPRQQITIEDLSFRPAVLTIPVDTVVTWVNHDNIAHTATAKSGEFNTMRLPPGAHYDFIFRTPGTFDYICTVHPQMKGTITVTGR